jgi:single-strand DNA-binding protein
MSLFLEGVVIGLAVAAPVGPIGVLCIRRTLAYGRTSGFVSGLGAATADAAYSSVAALGLTFVTDLLVDAEAWLRLGGGVFLVFLGVKTFLSRPAERPAVAGRGSLPGAYIGADAREPVDHPLIRGDLRRPRSRERGRGFQRAAAGPWRVPRLDVVVVRVERGDEPVACEAPGRRPAVGQQALGSRPRGFRAGRPLGARRLKSSHLRTEDNAVELAQKGREQEDRMVSFNRVILAGNLTRDPELRFTNDGIPVCSFGLAVNRVRSRNEEVDFFDISAWRELGETIANYKKKGDPILVEGRLQYRTWEAQDGSKRSKVDVVADNVQFLGRPGDSADGGAPAGGGARRGAQNQGRDRDEVDINEEDFEDIPFAHFDTRPRIVRDIL